MANFQVVVHRTATTIQTKTARFCCAARRFRLTRQLTSAPHRAVTVALAEFGRNNDHFFIFLAALFFCFRLLISRP